MRAFAALPGDRVALSETALYEMLLAREKLAPTTVGAGFALPHPRNPVASGAEIEVVHLCFFDEPVDFDTLQAYTKWKFPELPISGRWHVRLLYDRREANRRLFHRRQMADRRIATV